MDRTGSTPQKWIWKQRHQNHLGMFVKIHIPECNPSPIEQTPWECVCCASQMILDGH